jgi:hypothetical protein
VHRVHGGAQIAPCGAVRPSARVRALRGQHEELPLLPHARPVLADGTASVIQGGDRPDRPRQFSDNWMMIADWASGANEVWTWTEEGSILSRVCSDETAIEALERGHALPLTLITLSKSRLVSQ